MKLRNKKSGQKAEFFINYDPLNYIAFDHEPEYHSLAEFSEEWEDYEEPQEFWSIDNYGNVKEYAYDNTCASLVRGAKNICNCFPNKWEAKAALEKLEALKRLKDNGFRFDGWTDDSSDLHSHQVIRFELDESSEANNKDLDLLFGGEE